MGKIKILNPGLLSTIQDGGRYGYQEFGMPVAGAMDLYSLALANWCVGNDLNEACIEATILGPEIEFQADAFIAICGAFASVQINGNEEEMNKSISVKKGDILSFGNFLRGTRIYIAVAGGFKLPILMESKSTYLRAKIGGYCGRPLMSSDEIEFERADAQQNRSIPFAFIPEYKSHAEIRVIAGPEIAAFTMEGLQKFLSSTYQVSSQSDRMGYRLKGPKIEHKKSADIISSGLSTGSIQVPGHGEPIIMLADHQTIGGYTRIANVISIDIPIIGQMGPGATIKFKEVRLDEAQKLLQEKSEQLYALLSA